MWTRADLKSQAKVQMKGRYWNYLGVSLIPALMSYVASIPISIVTTILVFMGVMSSSSEFLESGNFSFFYSADNFTIDDFEKILEDMRIDDSFTLFRNLIATNIFSILANSLVALLVMYPITVGIMRWYVRARETNNLPLNVCFSTFKRNSYLKTVWAMLYYNFWLFIWFLLLWVPGIIKSYSYKMIPFILADNPNIGARRALKLSNAMTKGHKMDMFVLDLSFIGWYLLGWLACCIGIIAVVPYHHATMAELYDVLKKEAVDKGSCTMQELGYVPLEVDD